MFVITAKQKNTLKNKVEILSKIKTELLKSPVAKKICKEYGFSEDIIEGIQIDFEDIDVSAKTINSEIFLSNDLIPKGLDIMIRYAIHELVHALQHMEREGESDPYDGKEYLDRPDELEAFQAQIEEMEKREGPGATKEYVNNLVEYHELPEEDADEKQKELLGES